MEVRTVAGGHDIRFSDDDGPQSGIQRITIVGGGSGTVRVLGSTTYLKADQTALAGYFGLPAQAAKRAANRWLSLVHSDSGYANVTEGVLLSSAISELTISSPLRLLPPQPRDGSTVVGVVGGAGGHAPAGAKATLWVDASTGLPVEYDASAAGGDSITSRMSAWGQPVAVTKPAASTSISRFGG